MSARTRAPLRLLQTSDVHLGPLSVEPDGRAHAAECTCPVEVAARLVDEHDVDVLLVVGDLFDHARVSEDLVARTFARLGAVPADVFLLPGNHDVYDERTVYRRHRDLVDRSGVAFVDRPEGASVDLADGRLRIWGRAMEEHSPAFRPLEGVTPPPDDRWFVAAAHGHFVPDRDGSHRSSLITPADIDATGADYVALGHWHVTTDLGDHGVTTPAWYCGAPLFGYGARHMLLIDLVEGRPPSVRPVDVLDHEASLCPPATD